MKYIPAGVDIAKHLMQVHFIDEHTGEVIDKQIKRDALLEYFSNREPCLIGMEACGGPQHWARELEKLGHKVRLLQGKFVKAFVMGNKNDVMDARAIWMAAKRCARGGSALDKAMPEVLERLKEKLPPFLIYQIEDQYRRLSDLDMQIEGIEKQLAAWAKQNEACQRNMQIPGVGPLVATAAVAIMGDAGTFRSGREFAAYISLVPKQTGTGGKVRLWVSASAVMPICGRCLSMGPGRPRWWRKNPIRG